jgi:hypothetical protein
MQQPVQLPNGVSMPADWVRAQSAVGCLCASGQSAATVEELVSLHDVQAYHQLVARTVGVSSAASSHGALALSGIGRLAAQPPLRESWSDQRFVAPIQSSPKRWSVLEEPSERIRGKGAFQTS